MKTDLVQQILDTERGVKQEEKGVYVLGDEVELTVLLDLGHESLTVNRVRKLNLQAELVVLETHKGERLYLGPDTPVRGLKFAESESGSGKLRGAGFSPK